ncbi:MULTISPECIES: hypothetical protein [Moorena]|uniref:Uncharacterized protein n=1 Tax=Moorena producens (strain JHB) TaxID=1454205 RepID=A0A9Q9ST33_MOOP1|nr:MULTISPECIES: hypothetical protein [Moorena]NES45955.1 hypothetical protein [Moorena sp. SIO2C4]WAN69143.1 hypothetical protein BJP36_43075 [Moorena producens JHB]
MNQTIGENAIDRRSRYAIAFAQVDVVDVGWAVHQTDSPSQSPLLGTAHQTINHS